MKTWFEDAGPRRIAVFRALQLGDLLCSIPALRALRRSAPDAHIALVGLPSMATFAARYPHYIDELIPFPGAPGFPEQEERSDHLPRFVDAMRARGFDLAIQMHGNDEVANDLVRSFAARTMAGFHQPRVHDEGASGLFVDWDVDASEVRRQLALIRRIGASRDLTDDCTMELPVTERERQEWRALRRECGLDGATIVCVHAGARWPSRRWPLDRFVAVARDWSSRGARIVLTGSLDEVTLVGTLETALRAAGVTAVNLAARTTLGTLAALLADTRLLVCNDTGISHVAAAVGTPSVVVASGSDVDRWAPTDTRRHRVLAHQVPCRPCMYRECPIDHPCAKGVAVAAVLAASLYQEKLHAA